MFGGILELTIRVCAGTPRSLWITIVGTLEQRRGSHLKPEPAFVTKFLVVRGKQFEGRLGPSMSIPDRSDQLINSDLHSFYDGHLGCEAVFIVVNHTEVWEDKTKAFQVNSSRTCVTCTRPHLLASKAGVRYCLSKECTVSEVTIRCDAVMGSAVPLGRRAEIEEVAN